MHSILRPIITEKTLGLAANRQYTFEVDTRANVITIGQEIANYYKVTVLDVRIIRVSGKVRRTRRGVGQTRQWKKAIVQLAQGQKIPGFELEIPESSKSEAEKEATPAKK